MQEFNRAKREAAHTGASANPRGCKYNVNAAMMIFDVKDMAKPVPMGDLKDLIFILLSKLMDQQAHHALTDNPEIMRAVNILMLKMIGNNFGYAFSANCMGTVSHPKDKTAGCRLSSSALKCQLDPKLRLAMYPVCWLCRHFQI